MDAISRRRRPQLGDEAASYLRDQITSGTLAPGAHVRPEVIAAQLGISTTPAREALQALRAEGFLELAPRRGFTVRQLTGDDVRDMFLANAMIAGELAARVAERGQPDVAARLEEIHTELTACARKGDDVRLEQLNHDFHREINLASGAPKLAWVIQLVSRYAPRRFYASIEGWPEMTVKDHTGILKAIESGDPEQARREMSEHIIRAGAQLALHIDAMAASRSSE